MDPAEGRRAIDQRSFHRWLGRRLRGPGRGLLPIGDDAAALRPPPGTVAILSTDALVEGSHFRDRSPPRAIGAAAAHVSLSDLAAKGARPAALLIDLVLPPGSPSAWARAVTDGADRAGRLFGAPVVGGDTKPGPLRAVVSTALGWAAPTALAPRHGARPGDRLVTTGVVGRGGLAAARWDRARGRRPLRLLSELLALQPRVPEGRVLAPLAHAMLDTSDGLAESARLLAEASRVRIVVDDEALPVARGYGRDDRLRSRWLFFGGDYELLAAVPSGRLGRAHRAVARVGGRLTEIGSIRRGADAWLRSAGAERPMPPAGWQPFSTTLRR